MISDVSSKRINKAEEFQRYCEIKTLHPAGVLRDFQFVEIIRRMLQPGRTDWTGLKPSIENLTEITEMVTYSSNPFERDFKTDDETNAWLFRMMHRQYWDQHDIRSPWLRGLFITKELLPSIRSDKFETGAEIATALGMKLDEFLFLGFGLFAETTQQPGRVFGPEMFIDASEFNVEPASATQFFDLIGCDFQQFGAATVHPDTFVPNYEEYSLTPLLRWPALKLPDAKYSVPVPRLLLGRLTVGVYYDLIGSLSKKESGHFGNAWGQAFEQYVGALLPPVPGVSDVTSLGEEVAGQTRCDWIMRFGDSALLIECKTRGLSPKARMTGLREDIRDAVVHGQKGEGSSLAGGLVQLMKTRGALLAKHPGLAAFHGVTRIIAVLVTLDSVFQVNTDYFRGILESEAMRLEPSLVMADYQVTDDPAPVSRTVCFLDDHAASAAAVNSRS